MKRLLVFVLLIVPLMAMAQRGSNSEKIPVYGGQVSFRETISSLVYNNKVKLKENLFTGINTFLKRDKNKKGALLLNDTVSYKMAIQITDLLDVEEKALSAYSIWTKYLVEIDYSQKDCLIEVRNIVFIDTGKEKDPNPEKFNENAFTAEEMFLENKYRMSFVKDASLKVRDSFILEVDNLFTDIKTNIN